MCGFAGILAANPDDSERIERVASCMARSLRHRGPDGSGQWTDRDNGLSLAFRRLAILDLSPTGHQPMTSRSNRYTVVYNGEIYNHPDLRNRLRARGRSFRGTSDTETLLEAVDQWGLSATLSRLNGMYSFALWDADQRSLHLVRDRLGIKPLYYGADGNKITFASEIKALLQAPGMGVQEDDVARGLYFRLGYIPAPFSIFSSIRKLCPGHVLTATQRGQSVQVGIEPYWSLDRALSRRRQTDVSQSDSAATEELEELLLDAVVRRTMADVPVGAFLSGGTDSSLVVSLMQKASSEPVRTFTISFEDTEFDESTHARNVSKYLGTDHTELSVTESDLYAIVPKLGGIYGEPFADPSQIPTVLLSSLTRQYVTVSLSGDGGDELFAGYDRYREAARIWSLLRWVPKDARRGIVQLIRRLRAQEESGSAVVSSAVELLSHLIKITGAPTEAVSSILECDSYLEVYGALRSLWAAESVSPEFDFWTISRFNQHTSPISSSALQTDVERGMYYDSLQYLPDDILTKVDRASMQASLEVRVPLLDHRVVETAWQLPAGLKIKNGESKWLLKQVLRKHLPNSLVDRPKKGFNVPLRRWLIGPLRAWGEELLENETHALEGIISEDVVHRRWRELQEGREDWSSKIWTVLVYLSWRRNIL